MSETGALIALALTLTTWLVVVIAALRTYERLATAGNQKAADGVAKLIRAITFGFIDPEDRQ